MYTLYGIWLDHAHAFVVKTNKLGDSMEIVKIDSSVPPHHHDGIDGGEHHTIVNQHKAGEIRKNEMRKFCKEIIEHLQNPDEIIVFGPGTAKNELKNHIEDNKSLASKLRKIETTDKMLTESDLKEEVKLLFNLPRS